jgi:TetR/AcrR family transcriptional regulator of autoinduction and epiphytic fitness
MSNENMARVDGRTARGERARVAVATALLDLLEEGIPEPTAGEIAARARVSERLVFHHFRDLEALHASAAELQMARQLPLIRPVDPGLPLERRLSLFVRTRGRFYEKVSPVRRAAGRREPFSPEIGRRLKSGYEMARNLACAVFSRELALMPPAEATEVSQALSAAASWETWDYLRTREGLPVPKAEKVVARTIRAVLAGSRAAPRR